MHYAKNVEILSFGTQTSILAIKKSNFGYKTKRAQIWQSNNLLSTAARAWCAHADVGKFIINKTHKWYDVLEQ